MLLDTDQDRFRIAVTDIERRVGKRHATVLLIGKVRHARVDSACLVHDISRFGMMARFTVPPTVGDVLSIELRGLPDVSGTVRWVNGLKAGLEFDPPQDIDRMLGIRHEQGVVARMPRFAIQGTATLMLGDVGFTVEMLDISPGGVKLHADQAVTRGQAGRIVFADGVATVYGSVCWQREGRFGFRFAAPLPLATMSRIMGC